MRHATLVLGLVLLAGCASKPAVPPPPPPGPGPTPGPGVATVPPLCNSQPGLTAVLIEVDPTAPQGQQVNPKTCTVGKKTSITLRESHNTAFRVDFLNGKTPDKDKRESIASQPVGSNQEVTFTTKSPLFKHSYEYDVYVGTTKLDPTIIIDP